jgi:hypothetical protein
LKKTDADLIWEALLAKAQDSLIDENTGLVNKPTLDRIANQRDKYDLELSTEEKAVLDQMIKYLSKELPADEYVKANKLSSIWNYIKKRMNRSQR